MIDARDLERQYRRWLSWFPTSFRREHADEILGVLLAGTRDGQRCPDPMDCLDLMSNGLRLRLRQMARSGRSASMVVPLLWLGALMELAAAMTILATANDLRASDLSRNVHYTDAQWSAVIAGYLQPVALAALAVAVVWLALAWAIARGHRSAAIAMAALLGVNVLSLVNGVTGGSATSAPTDTLVGTALCVVQLVALVIAWRELLAWHGSPRLGNRSGHRSAAAP